MMRRRLFPSAARRITEIAMSHSSNYNRLTALLGRATERCDPAPRERANYALTTFILLLMISPSKFHSLIVLVAERRQVFQY